MGVGLLLFFGIVLVIADLLLPQVYFAKVTMEVKPDSSSFLGVFEGNPEQRKREYREQFIARQFQLLRGPEILEPVIGNLLLLTEWAKDGQPLPMQKALVWLADSIELRERRDTGLIEIGVYAADPQEAANIANTIAVVYQQRRLAELQKILDRGLEQLKDEVEKQRKRAEDALAEAAKIRERDGIVDLDPDGMGLSGPTSRDNADLRTYLEAKDRALKEKRIYEAAKTKYATELMERGIDFDPAKIWEKAEPPTKPARFCLYRLRYAFRR